METKQKIIKKIVTHRYLSMKMHNKLMKLPFNSTLEKYDNIIQQTHD